MHIYTCTQWCMRLTCLSQVEQQMVKQPNSHLQNNSADLPAGTRASPNTAPAETTPNTRHVVPGKVTGLTDNKHIFLELF